MRRTACGKGLVLFVRIVGLIDGHFFVGRFFMCETHKSNRLYGAYRINDTVLGDLGEACSNGPRSLFFTAIGHKPIEMMEYERTSEVFSALCKEEVWSKLIKPHSKMYGDGK